MKKLFICLLSLYAAVNVHAQGTEEHKMLDRGEQGGNLLYFFQKEDIQGSQFLKEQWMPSVLYAINGARYESTKLKFDTYNNKFIFEKHDTAFELSGNVSVIYMYPNASDTINKMVFKKGYSINGKINPDKYVQVVAEGPKLSLLKYYFKDQEEYTEYGNATRFKRFKDQEQYYLVQNNQYEVISLSAKNLEAQTGAKWPQVSAYLKQNGMSGKNEKDWAAAIRYYNSL